MSWRAKSSHLLFLLPKTKGGSTPLRSGRHDIPLGNFGYTNPGTALARNWSGLPDILHGECHPERSRGPRRRRFCRYWGGGAKDLLFLAPENKSGFFAPFGRSE